MTLTDAVMRPSATQTLARRARADGVQFILATFTTMAAKPCAKLVPVSAADQLESEGVGFAGYAARAMGQVPSDPDLMALPDISTYVPVPFVRPGLGIVHCDPHVEGVPSPFAPRVILAEQIRRAAELGMTLKTGAEIEYFLLDKDAQGLRTADPRDDAAQPCYDARGLTRQMDHLAAVSQAMEELGWGPYASDHEDGNGQFEQNFHYADAMTTADRVVTARYLIQMLAEQRGMTATYMPKPFTDRTGSGLHLHLSLWRDGESLVPSLGAADPYGMGLSPTAYSFVAGLLDHAPGMLAVAAPTVNSYKRTGATTTTSGATWAPSRATYGGNDRMHMLRIPDDQRVELRVADGSASSHLTTAVALGAGLDGIAGARDVGAPGLNVPGRHLLPRTLIEAVAEFEADPVMREVLDGADPSAGVSSYYAELKRQEFYTWHAQVTPWEVDRYLTAI